MTTAYGPEMGSYFEKLMHDDPSAWSPEEKIKLVEAMGFTRMGDSHDWDCLAARDSGFVCNCVPPAPWYNIPKDVAAHLGEDWDSRLKRARARDRR